MKSLKVVVEGKKVLEIKVADKELKTVLQVISIFDSGKIVS
jgi:hypothetical protein